MPKIAEIAKDCQNCVLEALFNFGDVWQSCQFWQFSHPIPKSADDSNGVPHTRHITAEQSPQIRGSVTSQAQLGQ